MITLPKYVYRVKVKGRYYYYHHPRRRSKTPGKRTRIHPAPNDPEFWNICAILNDEKTSAKPDTYKNSFHQLIDEYLNSPKYQSLAPRTQIEIRRHIEVIRSIWGDLQVEKLQPKHVQKLYDSHIQTPSKAGHLVSYLSAMIKWGVSRGYRNDNPCQFVERIKLKSDGYQAWPDDIINIFFDKASPYMCDVVIFALYTGQRQSDVLKIKWKDINNGVVSVKQNKTGKILEIPMHNTLKTWVSEIRSRTLVHHEFVLLNSRGRPWKSGFKSAWQRQVQRLPEIKGFIFHGLRRNAVNSLLESGCTLAEVASVTGQSLKMIEHYSQNINQKKMAQKAIGKTEQKTDK